MIKFTIEQIKLLEHMFSGGTVIDDNLSKYSNPSITLKSLDSSKDLVVEGTEVLKLNIFKDEKDLEIERLQAIISDQNAYIQNIAKKQTTKTRKAYNSLSNEEKEELIKYAVDNPTMTKISIAKIFEVSDTYVATILDKAGVRKIVKRM